MHSKGTAATPARGFGVPPTRLDPAGPSAHKAAMIGQARKPAVNICCGIIITS
jgi:hypothetical protein